jgi:hypothetical protein
LKSHPGWSPCCLMRHGHASAFHVILPDSTTRTEMKENEADNIPINIYFNHTGFIQ